MIATPKGRSEGAWDSIHVFEATDRGRTSHYKLTSTVILQMSTESETLGEMDLSGNMTRQIEQDMAVLDDAGHIVNVGKLVEDMELKMRNLLRMHTHNASEVFFLADLFLAEEVYFGKAKDVVGDLRSKNPFIYFSFCIDGDFCRCRTLDRCESGQSNSSRDDQFDVEAMREVY